MIIDYPSSPTGKVYIEDAKEPLMKTPTGIGFMGCIIENENRDKVQCFECGRWFKELTGAHFSRCFPAGADAYKEKFGLYMTTGLNSLKTHQQRSESMKNAFISDHIKTIQANSVKVLTTERRREIVKKALSSFEYQNRHGTCPAQLEESLRRFIIQKRQLPNSTNGGCGLRNNLKKRFGPGMNNVLEHFKLPTFTRSGRIYVFDYPNGKFDTAMVGDSRNFFETLIATHPFFNQNQNAKSIQSAN